jgi:hypothetical protein
MPAVTEQLIGAKAQPGLLTDRVTLLQLVTHVEANRVEGPAVLIKLQTAKSSRQSSSASLQMLFTQPKVQAKVLICWLYHI